MYGEGVFETLRVIDHQLPLLRYHWQRVTEAAEQLGLCVSLDVAENFIRSLDLTGIQWLRLQWSPRSTGRGYGAQDRAAPCHLLIWAGSELTSDASGVKLRRLTTQLPRRSFSHGLKMVSAPEYSQAARELAALVPTHSVSDGLLLTSKGDVIETTRSNIIFIGLEGIVTPCLREYGVGGVMRRALLEQAKLKGWKVVVRPIHYRELDSFTSVYVSNALMGCRPVDQIDSHYYSPSNTFNFEALSRELGFNDD